KWAPEHSARRAELCRPRPNSIHRIGRHSRSYGYSHWTPEGVEPSFPGCRPGVFPLDDGPVSLRTAGCGHIAGRDRTFSLGLRRAVLFRLSYRNALLLLLLLLLLSWSR